MGRLARQAGDGCHKSIQYLYVPTLTRMTVSSEEAENPQITLATALVLGGT